MDSSINRGRYFSPADVSYSPERSALEGMSSSAASQQALAGQQLPYRPNRPNIMQLRHQSDALHSQPVQAVRFPSTGDVKLDEAIRFLNDFDVTRLGVEAAGGRGSVSSSMEMLRTLLKFAPPHMEFQVVYEKTRKEVRSNGSMRIDNVAEKLEQVLGKNNFQIKLKRQVVNFHGTEILFVEEGSLTNRDRPRGHILGMVGANDAPDHHVGRWHAKLGNNAVVGNVSVICTGEPHEFDYAGPPSLFFPGPIVPGKNPLYLKDIPTGYPVNIPNLGFDELESVVARLPEDTPGRKHKKKVISRIFKLCGDEQVDLLPVYGLHHPRMKEKGTNRDVDLITNTCRAIRLARKRGQNRTAIETKPTIIAVLGEFKDIREYKGSSKYRPDMVCKAWEYENQVEAKLKKLADGQIMCIYLGNLKTEIFDQFLAKATLPPWVEGANSSDKCQKLPKEDTVYLQMLLRGTKYSNAEEFEQDEGRISRGRDFVTTVSERLTKGHKSEDDHRNIRNDLAQVYCDSRVPTSSIRQYYQRVSEAAKRENQVVELLYSASHEVRAREQKSEEAEGAPGVIAETAPSRRGLTYRLWTDGDVSYRAPNMPADAEDEILSLELGDPKKFGRDHWEWLCDLKVTAINLNENGDPLFSMTGPRGEAYVFLFSEENQSLKLIQKNGEDQNKKFTYKLKLAEEVERYRQEQNKENQKRHKPKRNDPFLRFFRPL